MKTKTAIESAKNISNVVYYSQGNSDPYWVAYRKDVFGKDQLWTGQSATGRDWTVTELKGIGVTPRLDTNPQLVVSGNFLYLFWMDDDSQRLRATLRWFDPDTGAAEWLDYVDCLSPHGDTIEEPDGAKDKDAVMAAVDVGTHVLVTVTYENTLRYYLFPSTRDSYRTGDNEWTASSETHFTVPVINSLLTSTPKIREFGRRTSFSFYSVAPDPVNWTYLVQSVLVEDTAGTERIAILQLRLQTNDGGFGLPVAEGVANYWKNSDHRQMLLTRDPGGRVVASFVNENRHAHTCLMNTGVFPGVWGDNSRLGTFTVDENPVLFYAFGNTTPTTVDGKTAEERSVTEWALLQDDDDDTYSVDRAYGRVRRIFKYETLNLSDSTDRFVYVQGYVDGPPPVFDGMRNATAEVHYAETSSTEFSFQVVTNQQIGIKSEGKAGIELAVPVVGDVGITAPWEMSLTASMQSAFAVGRAKSLDENTVFQLQTDGQSYSQTGLMRGSEIIATRDVFHFVPTGSDSPALDTSEYSQVYLDIRPDTKVEYELGKDSVVVGDLETYTKDAWNERMKQSGLYPGVEDYISEIVLPNAISFENGTSAIRDTWTPGSPIDGTFSSTNQQYLSASMTIEAEVIRGVGGTFMGNEASVLLGFKASIGTTAESVSTRGFGLSMTIDGDKSEYVDRYRVSAYFLKASSDWIREFKYFQDTGSFNVSIEDDAACWKVMYVVDQIEYIDPLTTLDLGEALVDYVAEHNMSTTRDALDHLEIPFAEHLNGDVRVEESPIKEQLLEALKSWNRKRNIYTTQDAEVLPQDAEQTPVAQRH